MGGEPAGSSCRTVRVDGALVTGFARALRSPLTSIVGAAELFGEQGLGAGEMAELQEMLHRNAAALRSVVVEFLDALLLEAGELAPVRMALDARKVIERAVLDVREACALGPGEIELCMEDGDWNAVMLDADRLRAALRALVASEVGSGRAGRVRVVASEEGAGDGIRRVRVGVCRSEGGVGPVAGRCEGAGFRVALARTLVRALGGEIREIGSDGMAGVEVVLRASLAGAAQAA